jgi:hypothetical protein
MSPATLGAGRQAPPRAERRWPSALRRARAAEVVAAMPIPGHQVVGDERVLHRASLARVSLDLRQCASSNVAELEDDRHPVFSWPPSCRAS